MSKRVQERIYALGKHVPVPIEVYFGTLVAAAMVELANDVAFEPHAYKTGINSIN
ncbi:hypothetical protein Ocin01_17169 [Orchesella cincta]|uniref:Uncharacterized protein n=1 Tax=Orchesella cincta TaxID=48709 RepID=A0A1D2M957_ORCCI|nr:hypothetical protein Ocin01_17169 [Orchesella cincta]